MSENFQPPKRPRAYSSTRSELEHLLTLVRKYGTNSNSFLALYPGYQLFSPPDLTGTIAFLETKHAWVGVAEPLAPAEETIKLLKRFGESAGKIGKRAMCLPISQGTLELAGRAGFGYQKIGGEPVFLLKDYKPNIDTITTAKRLSHKGAQVREINPKDISRELKKELDGLVIAWLGTRKMGTLSFVNRVEPWTLSEHKKYFAVELGHRVLAFLAAVPVPARNGWYLIDVFRGAESPPGSTELLVLETLRILKEMNVDYVSMGVAPLSDLNLGSANPNPVLTLCLGLIYLKGNLFYNFKSLHQYKLKFQPTKSESAFLIYYPDRLGPRNALGLLHAFLGRSLTSSLWLWLDRHLSIGQLVEWLQLQSSEKVIFRGKPLGFWDWVKSTRLSLFYILSSILVSIALGGKWLTLDPLIVDKVAVTIAHVSPPKSYSFLLAPFFHRNALHLSVDILIVALVGIPLEFLTGSLSFLLSFLIPLWFTLPLFGSLLRFLVSQFSGNQPPFMDFRWLGASLGLFGLWGAYSALVRVAWPMYLGTLFGIVNACWLSEKIHYTLYAGAYLLGVIAENFVLKHSFRLPRFFKLKPHKV